MMKLSPSWILSAASNRWIFCLWILCCAVLSHVRFFATLWIVAGQTLSMRFSRQDWSGLPFPAPGDLPDTGIEPVSLVSPALASGFFTTVQPGKSLLVKAFKLLSIQSWWWTGKPGVLQSIGVTKSWAWLSNWTELYWRNDVVANLEKTWSQILELKRALEIN